MLCINVYTERMNGVSERSIDLYTKYSPTHRFNDLIKIVYIADTSIHINNKPNAELQRADPAEVIKY